MIQDCVADLSHHQGLSLDFVKAKASGIKAIIHKCTQSTRYQDPRYVINRQHAIEAGMLTGCYHFGTGTASGKAQADYFLSTAKQGDLLCLDFEPNSQGLTMTLAQAIEFCAEVENETHRPIMIYTGFPMLASGLSMLQFSTIADADTIPTGLVRRSLWWAQYASSPSRAPKDWPLTLWQYTEAGLTDGIGHCDRNEFYGDDDALTKLFSPSPWDGIVGGASGSTET